jgi:hypothetical protein
MTVAEAVADCSLLIDVGSGWTKGVVVAQSRGRWRIAAAVSQPTGWGQESLIRGLTNRLRPHADPRLDHRLEAILADAPRVFVRSLPRIGRLAVSGADSGSADRAAVVAAAAGWEVVETGAVGDGRSPSARLTALMEVEPDAWLLAAGSGPTMAEAVREAAALLAAADGGRRRPMLFSGRVDRETAELLGLPADQDGESGQPSGVRLRADLDAELLRAGGLESPRNWASAALERSVVALAHAIGRDVLAVDIGVEWGTWVTAAVSGHAARTVRRFGGDRPDQSLDGELTTQLAAVTSQTLDEQTANDHLVNALSRPGTLPQTPAEAAVGLAVLRTRLLGLRRQAGGAPPVDLIVGGGRGLAGGAHPAEAALTLLDTVRPSGIVQLALDASGALPVLGALPDGEVAEGVLTLLDDLFVPLGTAVVTRGGRSGHPALRLRLHRIGWPPAEVVEVRAGSLTVLPLGRGERGEIEIELIGNTSLGGHRGTRLRAEVSGGALGVIVDARDDPIQLPSRPGDRRAVLGGWRDALRRDLTPESTVDHG